MQKEAKKPDQLLAKERGAKEREALMLYLANMGSPYRGWGGSEPIGWTDEEYRQFTKRLRDQTEKHWPELWQHLPGEEGRGTSVEERAWHFALRIQEYLRNFWRADNEYDRDWHIHRAREYHYSLEIVPELLKSEEALRPAKQKFMLDQPPGRSPIAKALYELQKRAQKPALSPRICPNECENRFFLSTKKGQKFCPDCRRAEAQNRSRSKRSKLKSYHGNKENWPSTANRSKRNG
jgi:hypothetical protein